MKFWSKKTAFIKEVFCKSGFVMGILCMTVNLLAQQDIEIKQEQKDNILLLRAVNNSSVKKYSVHLILETQGYKITPPPPYEFVIGPGEEHDIVHLIPKKDETTSLGYKIQYSLISGGSKSLSAKFTAEEVDQRLGLEGLIIFTKETCEKCKYSKAFLNGKKIPFVEMPLESEENSDLMWSALFNEGFDTTVIATPIFSVKGKLHYNIEDLDKFLQTLIP